MRKKEIITKRFPASPSLEVDTFLNNDKIDAKLYAFLQSKSKPRKNEETGDIETIVWKMDLPKQAVWREKLRMKSVKTLRSHLKQLIEFGYVIDDLERKCYVLPNVEDQFFMIPLDTLFFFQDVLRENVYKVYVYLGVRYSWRQARKYEYVFSREELLQHLGLSHQKTNLDIINHILTALKNSGFIDYVPFFDGVTTRLRLTKFSLTYDRSNIETPITIAKSGS